MIKKSLVVLACLCGLCFAQSSGGNRSGSSVQLNAATFGISTAAADNSAALNAAMTALGTAGGSVIIPAGVYNVCAPIVINASFVSLIGGGPMGASSLVNCTATASPNNNLIQIGSGPNCSQAFGTVTVTGATNPVVTLPVANSLGSAGAVTATSSVVGANVVAVFTGTFSGTTGIQPTHQQKIVGTGFTGATGYNSAWTVISSTATTITAYQPGASPFGAGATGTLNLSFSFPAVSGTWNGQQVFLNAATPLIVASQTSTQLNLTGNYPGPTGAGVPFQGVYSGCPIGVRIENLTLDGNCGSSNQSTGLPCQLAESALARVM